MSRRSLRAPSLALVLVALVACGEEPPPEIHKLTDIYSPVVQLNTGSVPGGPEVIQLFVHPQLVGKCHPIPTLAATLDGKPMTRLTGRVGGALPYDRDCSVFEFSLDPEDIVRGPTNELRVTDGETTFRVVVTDLFAPRTIVASPTEVKPGEVVTLAWSPATDTVDPKGDVGLELKAGDKRAIVKRAAVTFAPGSLSFAMPEGLVGDVSISVFGTASVQPPVTTCEGASTCGVSREYDVPAVTVRVTP